MPKDAEVAAVWVDVGALTPWAGNPRHNSAAIKEVKASIKRFGFASPIIARKADGMVIAGHTRLAAARGLGIERVPVRYLDLDPAEARLLALADNKLGEIAGWDTDKLAAALRELDTEGALEGLEGVGFTSDEIDALMADPGDAWDDALSDLPEGDRQPIQTMTFTLHDDQAALVQRAIAAAASLGEYGDTGNSNGNGNALARVCELWLGRRDG